MSEHTTHSPDSWGKVFNSAEDARHPHTIKQPNHPDVVVERVEELEDTVTRLTLEMAEVNKKLDHHDAVLYKLGVALYDRKLANKEAEDE